MTTTLNFDLRRHLRDLRDDGRLNLLIALVLHANIRLRCWPSIPLLIDETGWSVASVNDAKKWLLEHKAIMLVPYELRVDEETKLPRAQHVYQLTGLLKLDDKTVPYLYMAPEAVAAVKAVLADILLSKNSAGEILAGENKVLSNPKEDSSLKFSFENESSSESPRRPYSGSWITPWNATLSQFQIQMSQATYDTWLKHLVLLDVIECQDATLEFQAEAPHKYAREWIEKNLLFNFERNLLGFCHFGEGETCRRLPSGVVGQGVRISISTKGTA